MTDTDVDVGSVLHRGTPVEDREQRLTGGADELTGRHRRSFVASDRFLLTVSAVVMTLGITLIVLGWIGSARTTFLEEQIPYLISGGLLGVALSTIGAVSLFAHWLTVLIRENRAHEELRRRDHAEHMAKLDALIRGLALR